MGCALSVLMVTDGFLLERPLREGNDTLDDNAVRVGRELAHPTHDDGLARRKELPGPGPHEALSEKGKRERLRRL